MVPPNLLDWDLRSYLLITFGWRMLSYVLPDIYKGFCVTHSLCTAVYRDRTPVQYVGSSVRLLQLYSTKPDWLGVFTSSSRALELRS